MCREEVSARLFDTDGCGGRSDETYGSNRRRLPSLPCGELSNSIPSAIEISDGAKREKRRRTICFRVDRQKDRETRGAKEILLYIGRIHTYEITIGNPLVRIVLAEKDERSANSEIYEI